MKVLDGGWKKWVDEGRPLSIDRPPDAGDVTFTPKGRRLAGMHAGLRGGACRETPDTVFLDVRSDERVGRLERPGQRARGSRSRCGAPGVAELHHRRQAPHYQARVGASGRCSKRWGSTPDKNVITY